MNGVVLASADAAAMSDIVGALTTAFASVQNNALAVIKAGLPYGLTIVGTVLAITIGIRVFKKIAGK